ncbi:sporulation-specific csd4-like protein [Cichlidogyrus casuarinus]|uniref:Sporulation-specific csd4-like protein n=1 Tax=Cichlidogyrus casuarinus TaxID=1844966 RepID=A0ABD2PTC0_9PLAT
MHLLAAKTSKKNQLQEQFSEFDQYITTDIVSPISTEPQAVQLLISDSAIQVVNTNGKLLLTHKLSQVSFAACSPDIPHYFCYVSKDETFERICLVFCSSRQIACDAVSALGDVFQFGFQKIKENKKIYPLEPPPRMNNNNHSLPKTLEDKNYINQLKEEPNLINFDDSFSCDGPSQRTPSKPLVLEPIGQPWYKGKINRKEAESFLCREGDFLVRASTKDPGQYILSGLWHENYIHLLLVDSQGQVRSMNCSFDSIEELIDFHVQGGTPICSSGKRLHLVMPASSTQTLFEN